MLLIKFRFRFVYRNEIFLFIEMKFCFFFFKIILMYFLFRCFVLVRLCLDASSAHLVTVPKIIQMKYFYVENASWASCEWAKYFFRSRRMHVFVLIQKIIVFDSLFCFVFLFFFLRKLLSIVYFFFFDHFFVCLNISPLSLLLLLLL